MLNIAPLGLTLDPTTHHSEVAPTVGAFIGNLGPLELTLILVAVLLLFGGRKLPELAKGLGEGLKEFRAASREAQKEDKDAPKEEPKAS